MPVKLKISDFLLYFAPHAVQTNGKAPDNPPAGQFGYVMGGDGRVADDTYLRARAKASYPDSWIDHYEDTLRWLGREVYDCNAAAEAFYKREAGIDINTKARLNYAGWCSVKSSPKPDSTLARLPQMPGVAVFSGGSTADGISHVGYLIKKYGSGLLDWWVLEFRGRNYGCVMTRIKDREWRYWGVMDRYYEYDIDAAWNPSAAVQPIIKIPVLAAPAAKLSKTLKLEYKLNADAVRFRKCPDSSCDIIRILDEGDVVAYISTNGKWTKVRYKGQTGYIFSDYLTRCSYIKGAEVKAVQNVLKAAGYVPGSIDGIYGQRTAEAVAAYQTVNHLTVDAIVGEITWAALMGEIDIIGKNT